LIGATPRKPPVAPVAIHHDNVRGAEYFAVYFAVSSE
jgi:hypothetical protein